MHYRVEWRNRHSGDADAEEWQPAELAPTKEDAEHEARQWVHRGYEARVVEVED